VTPAPAVRVLVVDDFELLRDTLVRGLQGAGFEVLGAGSMPAALAVPAEDYDVVVSDQGLGDALGTELFRSLHDRDPDRASRFVLITGDVQDLDLPAGIPVLTKPFRIGALVEAVRLVAGGGPDGAPTDPPTGTSTGG
jgi:two-component system C4-dicarboxylate transport response regulator DctD